MRVMSDSQKNQRARILRLLLQSKGAEVSAYELAQIALQYSARVFDLRKLGFLISNRTQVVNRVRRSWFRLDLTPINTRGTRLRRRTETATRCSVIYPRDTTIVDKKQMGGFSSGLDELETGACRQQAPETPSVTGNSSFGTHDELPFGFNRREYCSPAATYYDGTVMTTSTVCHGFTEPMAFRF
jgi:hypothetical protein